jgi:type IV pilus assembly protein PilY1
MRTKHLLRFAACAALLALGAPLRSDATSSVCSASSCLANSAVVQKLQPTSVTTDDRGDMSFFSAQSGQLPNVVFILDNSTSMYEVPYDTLPSTSSFPNTSWLTRQVAAPTWTVPTPVGATPDTGPAGNAADLASCHSNGFFEGLKDASNNPYNKSTVYGPADLDFPTYFASNNVYKFIEWTTSGAGGVADGTLPPGGTTGITAACNGTRLTTAQKRRCQLCIEESGYYIRPSNAGIPAGCSGGSCATPPDPTNGGFTDSQAGLFIFKGNWLNFNPPKFILARKVLTDFIKAQTATATPVRIGVATYDTLAVVNSTTCPGSSPGTVDQTSPQCPINVPATPTGLRTGDGGHLVTTGMAPDCNVTSWIDPVTHAAIAKQGALVSQVEAIDFGNAAAGAARHTPLAETLFNVGQFLSGSNTFYTNTFGASWLKSEFTAPTDASKPFCVSCQSSSVILITDGLPSGDNNLPSSVRTTAASCGANCGTDFGNGAPNALPAVAGLLAGTPTAPADLNSSLPGNQNISTHVIALGVSQTALPTLLKSAAAAGGGQAFGATNSSELQQRLADAVGTVVTRGTAFSAAALSSLQIGNGSSVYVPRFTPAAQSSPIWKGQLIRFNIFNEFTANQDLNLDGNKDGVFLVDFNKDIIVEDDKGNFVKQRDPTKAAVPVWDAGAALQGPAGAATFSTRKVLTAISDGAGGWTTIPFVDTDTTRIGPTLGLTDAICAQILSKMTSPPSSGSFGAISTNCQKAVIDWALGQDVFGVSPNVNRNPMLGDIFHSSPIVVDPPVDQFLCATGLHNQCLTTLFGYKSFTQQSQAVPATPDFAATTSNIDSYEKYWRDHETRPRIVMVGANDGMVHAFNGGTATATPPVVTGDAGFRTVAYNDGDGSEQWGFIPPDQLPRLALMMTQGHQFSLDGDIMVRDVWVDGKGNDMSTGTFVNQSQVKQPEEFHTVAVVSERQGGNHFFALDVTDTLNPKMLWMYPPPCSPDEQIFGQSWAQYAPHAPPIGPVLLQTSDTNGPKRTPGTTAFDHTEERWVVFLNGGHSPWNTRGRALAMLDVFTGVPLFKATYDSSSSPASGMKFGFSAPVAMVDYNSGDTSATDGFFDAAVVGDEGGQIWTAHFLDAGHVNTSTGLVDNWIFARAFETDSSSGVADPRFHQPIFTLASTTIQPNNGTLRAFVGTGDRAHIRSTGGGDCRPDDPASCVAAGCTVSSALTIDNGTNHYASTYASAASNSVTNPAFAAPTQSISTTSNDCNTVTANETMRVSNCTAAFPKDENLTFSCSGSPSVCTDTPFNLPRPDVNRGVAPSDTHDNYFMGLAILTGTVGSPQKSRRLDSSADVSTYDSQRLQLSDLTNVTAATATISSASGGAARDSAGWFVKYSNIDEKTGTGGTLVNSCVVWSSLTPSGGAVGCGLSGSTSSTFQANVFTGLPNCATSFLSSDNVTYVRSKSRDVLSPPPEAAPMISVSPGNRSMRSSLLFLQPASSGSSEVNRIDFGTSNDMLKLVSSVPLTEDQHACRHGTTPADKAKCP